MRFTALLTLSLTVAIPIAAQTAAGTPTPTPTPSPTPNGYVRPSGPERAKRYAKSMFGAEALGRKAVSAGIGTWRNSPAEWGGQWEGFGKRFASEIGKSVIKNTTEYALDEALSVDSHFYRSANRSSSARLKNALISPFTARKPSGKRTIGIPRIMGTYTSSVLSREIWYPNRYTWKDGLRSGTVSFGVSAASNLFREFVWK
ncbi:MAG: hypothetical protein ACKVQW_09015 [Pyrinomonadaceae bacterium]